MKKTINIFTDNIYPDWEIDEAEFIKKARKITEFFLDNYTEASCLRGFEFKVLSFDVLFCSSEKTHNINKEYRGKDYPANIITFAIFADDDSKFVLDDEINLGEIILALDKVKEDAKSKNVSDEYELYFMSAHGILHLLGFDHQTETDYNFVINAQEKALEYIGSEK